MVPDTTFIINLILGLMCYDVINGAVKGFREYVKETKIKDKKKGK